MKSELSWERLWLTSWPGASRCRWTCPRSFITFWESFCSVLLLAPAVRSLFVYRITAPCCRTITSAADIALPYVCRTLNSPCSRSSRCTPNKWTQGAGSSQYFIWNCPWSSSGNYCITQDSSLGSFRSDSLE